jgi:outer membrane protein OmpA-like peptidoglycan-associated protein
MKQITSICILLAITLFSITATAQRNKLSTKNKRAINAYEKGIEAFDKRYYSEAEKYFLMAIEMDDKFIEAYQLTGMLFEETKKYDKAIEYYEKVQTINPKFFANNNYVLGVLLLKEGRYEESLVYFKIYINLRDVNAALQAYSQNYIERAQFALELKNNPVPFNPENLGSNINTPNGEYSPTLTADEKTLYFTVLRPKDEYTQCVRCTHEEDFYVSYFKNDQWTKAIPLGHPINTHGNEGAACISPDGMSFIYTACNRDDGFGSCDLYISKREGGRWSAPQNMGSKINSSYWDSQPSIAPDGKTLYFASARNGKMDIYVSVLDDNGQWGEPVNIGKPVNTEKSEMSPFIHPDGKTLYFTSDGHNGMGGFDIFYTRKQNDNTWTEPVNLGYPINTHNDEGFFIVSASGETAYYASDNLGGYGHYDLYRFELPLSVRPDRVNYISGRITDKATGEPISAEFQLYNLETGELVAQSRSDDADGSFLLVLPSNASYALHVDKKAYLFYSEHFELLDPESYNEPIHKNIQLQPLKTGEIVVMKNIFFDFDSDALKDESKMELEKLVQLLTNNPSMHIEIRGHTDNIGSSQYNKSLSQRRALAVQNYLIKQGISKNRLTHSGFGDTQPIDTNDTDEGRANNRRTEFRVVKF